MNITKKLYVIISTIIILFFVLKLLIINKFFFVLEYFDLVFFFLVFLFFFLFYGKPRNKNYLKRISVRYMIMLLLSYVLIIYLFGFFMGFTKSIYSFNLLTILGNIIPVGLAIFFKEYTRFIVANKSFNHIGPYVLLTIFYISITIFNSYINTDFNNLFQVFNFICLTVLPTFAKEAVSSYITYNISYIPTLIYNLSFAIFPYVVPLYPDLGDYLNSILGIGFPFIIFLTMRKWIKYKDIDNIKLTNSFIKLICMPLIIFTSILVILISGVFSYKLIAIGSDSMKPSALYNYLDGQGWSDILMLDGGGSTQGYLGAGKQVTSTRKVHNYICVYLKKSNSGSTGGSSSGSSSTGSTDFTKPNPYTKPTRAIQYGMTGNDVRWVQYQLNVHEVACDVDGSFGPAMLAAVKELAREGKGTGRRSIVEYLRREGECFSEMRVRVILKELEEEGLIEIHRGRGGVRPKR